MQGYFKERGLDSPRLDAELLIAHALRVNRTRLYTHSDQPLTTQERDTLRALVKRRAMREPMAYILGVREFYGRDFRVSADVLVPRPETEHVVEEALAFVKRMTAASRASETTDSESAVTPTIRILDVGTGSGALAVTLAAEIPHASVIALDLSPAALAVARDNAEKLGVADRVTFYESDLFTALPQDTEPFDIIVANPPYVCTTERAGLMPDVRDYEPGMALFAGADGLDVLRPLCAQVQIYLRPGGLFLTEMGETQAAAVTALLSAGGRWNRLDIIHDLAALPRVVAAERA